MVSPLPTRAVVLGDGPWLSAFWVELPEVVSKSNFRRYRPDDREHARWARYKDFEANLRSVLLEARPPGWEVGERRAPLSRRPVVVVSVWARSRLDTANLDKSVLDAGQPPKVPAVVAPYLTDRDVPLYWNDASVRAVLLCSDRGEPDGEVGAVLGFACLSPGTTVGLLMGAVHELAMKALGIVGDHSR